MGNKTIKYEALLNSLLFIYLMSINIKLISDAFNVWIQNTSYLGLLVASIVILSRGFKITAFDKCFILFYCFACCSIFWTMSTENTVSILRIIGKIFVLCLFLPKVYNRSQKLRVTLLKIIYFSFLCVLTLLVFDMLIFRGFSQFQYLGEAYGLDSVRLTVRSALCASIGFYLFKEERNIIYIIIDVCLLIISLFTGKRTGILFFIVFIILYVLIIDRDSFTKRIKNLLIFLTASAVFFLLIFKVDALYNTIGIRIETGIATLFYNAQKDGSTIERRMLSECAVYLFELHPIRGNGINAVRTYLESSVFHHVTYSHNNYLELLAGIGIIGTSLFYSVYIYGIANAIKLIRKGLRQYKQFCAFCLSILIAYIVCDFIEVTYESYFEILILSIFINFIVSIKSETKRTNFYAVKNISY